jgi:hypothetical protein
MIVRSWQPKRRFRTGALDADVSFRRDVQACGAKNASLVSQLFLCLSRACLVLVKRSFLKIYMAQQAAFFLPRERQRARSIGCCGRLITTISTPAPMRKRLALGKTFVPSLSWKVIIFVFHSTGRQYVEDGWGEEVVF